MVHRQRTSCRLLLTGFLRKVYGIVSAQLLITTAVAAIFLTFQPVRVYLSHTWLYVCSVNVALLLLVLWFPVNSYHVISYLAISYPSHFVPTTNLYPCHVVPKALTLTLGLEKTWVRVGIGYEMTWVQVVRGYAMARYKLTWVWLDQHPVLPYCLTWQAIYLEF